MQSFSVKLSCLAPGAAWDGQGIPAVAYVEVDAAAAPAPSTGGAPPTAATARLLLRLAGLTSAADIVIPLRHPGEVWRAAPELLLVRAPAAAAARLRSALQQQQPHSQQQQQQQQPGAVALVALACELPADADALEREVRRLVSPPASSSPPAAATTAAGPAAAASTLPTPATAAASTLPPPPPAAAGPAAAHPTTNAFDAKTDRASADMYFHYYGMLQHQQNMLQDATRTGAYHAAIAGNRADFEGKTVMDVGAGSGILSLFAAQAGAKKVYAVEASGMARFAARLAAANAPAGGAAVEVLHSKIEELALPGGARVDVLVSEPMGTLLVNERMIETYVYARDAFLKPGGKMFPAVGRIHAAAFSDAVLYGEVAGRAAFWQQRDFYGVDLAPLYAPAAEGYFSQVVVDAFDPALLASGVASRVFDFSTVTEEELRDIEIPLELTVPRAPTAVHGIATWFDVLFSGSATQRWLSTAPGLPATHWFQLRCVLAAPIMVSTPGTVLRGALRLTAHARQSYAVDLELSAPPLAPGAPPQVSRGRYDLKDPYYRQLTSWAGHTAAAGAGGSGGDGATDAGVGAGGADPGDAAAAAWHAHHQQQQEYLQQQQQWVAQQQQYLQQVQQQMMQQQQQQYTAG